MASKAALDATLSLDHLFAFDRDVKESLRRLFPSGATQPGMSVDAWVAARFFGRTSDELRIELNERLDEADLRSVFFTLTSLEATFRVDYKHRCTRRLKDTLSRHFRPIYRDRGERVHLENDILAGWQQYEPTVIGPVGHLIGAFKLRHWIAHGRHFTLKPARTHYDFAWVHTLAVGIVEQFPFKGLGP
jgi:hypothetical protein